MMISSSDRIGWVGTHYMGGVLSLISMPKKSATIELPETAAKRLKPFIDRGIENGIFTDASVVTKLYYDKAGSDELKENVETFGGADQPIAQNYITDAVLVDLTSILRQKKYTANLEIWEVNHRTLGTNSGNPRPACFVIGQAVIEDGDNVLESAMFRMQLWDNDTSMADDLERDGTYSASVTCRNLDADVLDLKVLSGLTQFTRNEHKHGSREDLLRAMYDVTPIAELEDDISRGFNDYRLIEATVSYAGVKNSRAGNQFGSMMLNDDSTMTIEAIESGENLMLNALCSVSVANRFGKYSRILCLCTTRTSEQYGLSANIECAVGIVIVEPPQPTVQTGGDDSEDDAASYFSTGSDDTPIIGDDDDEEVVEEVKEVVEEAVEEAPKAEAKEAPKAEASDDDDDWEDWE